jgi:hypothetical protein
MTTNCRFALDERQYVIDTVNVANSGNAYYGHEGDPEDDKHLRECILRLHLGKMINKLIINSRPEKTSHMLLAMDLTRCWKRLSRLGG